VTKLPHRANTVCRACARPVPPAITAAASGNGARS
jgi:hypothetical protein